MGRSGKVTCHIQRRALGRFAKILHRMVYNEYTGYISNKGLECPENGVKPCDEIPKNNAPPPFFPISHFQERLWLER